MVKQGMPAAPHSTAPAYTMVGDSEYSSVKNLLARMEGVVRYEHHVPENFTNYWQHLDYFAVSAAMPENYQAPFDFIQPIIAEAAELDTDSEKVEYLNDYLCTLLAYKKGKTAGVTRTFARGIAGAVHQRLPDGVVERPVIGGGEHVRVGVLGEVLPAVRAVEV